jgi:predicted esterase
MNNYKLLTFLLFIFWVFDSFSQPIGELRKLFNYDKGLETYCKVISSRDTANCTISEVIYQGLGETKINAYLVIPHKMMRQYPVVLFYHGSNQEKYLFFNQAIELADQSIASLHMVQLEGSLTYTDPEKDFRTNQQTIINLRRSIDMLENHSQIDPGRLAFVGFDHGSWAGAVLSGVENRISTYILISCTAYPTNTMETSSVVTNTPPVVLSPEQKSKYSNRMKAFDPINYLGNRVRSSVLFQYPEAGTNGDSEYFQKLFLATKEPKQLAKYNTNLLDIINFPEAVNDRLKWLKNHL